MKAHGASYDYIIVGGGSAGCVLASRLSEDPDTSVLLLEAGPSDRSLFIHMPAGVHRVWQDPAFNWSYKSEIERDMNGRNIPVPRGKVLGGSSSINSMVYLRGHPTDYDRWASEFDLPEWSYAHCLPYFKKAEKSERGANDWHGDSGPLGVSRGTSPSILYDVFVQAGEEAGVGKSDDLNGYRPEGLGLYDSTKWNGRRCSAAVGYLHPVRSRANLKVLTSAHVIKVEVERGRARAVTFTVQGQMSTATAGSEIILCGGAVNSPQLLMLSGIGPSEKLAKVGIGTKHELPGVGQNLQDHIDLMMQWECLKPVTLKYLENPLVQAAVGTRWLIDRKGPVASNVWEAGGLVRTQGGLPGPDIQYHFGAVGVDYEGRKVKLKQGFQVHIAQLRQDARGSIELKSDNAKTPPAIKFNFLQTERDRNELVNGVLLARHIVNQPVFREFIGKEYSPGPSVKSRAEFLRFIQSVSETEFHPSCTCRMGHDDMAVVGPDLKVRGIDGLRVVDASVMPNVISSNLNATVIMIAEKAADIIRGRNALAPFRPRFFFDDTPQDVRVMPEHLMGA